MAAHASSMAHPTCTRMGPQSGDAYARKDACLMNLDEPPRERHPYSVELDGLVYRCVAKRPSARPLPTELRHEVRDTFRRLKWKNYWKAETPDVGTGNPK